MFATRAIRASQAANGKTRFGYDATDAKNKRRPPSGVVRSEDAELSPDKRRKLISAQRDLHRNFAVAAWGIRRHLDYVSTFAFQAKTGNDALDDRLEELVREWSDPMNCDVAARHSLPRLIRIAEMRRTIDGDVFLLALADGRVQAIEGDRVRTPVGGVPASFDPTEWQHGVRTDAAGRAIEYAVSKRSGRGEFSPGDGGFVFEKSYAARFVYHHGYFDRFDQIRGVSPLAAAVNSLQDTYEGFDYALAKMKVAQMFGLVVYREAAESLMPTSASEEDGSKYQVDPGRGPVFMDLDPGDRAEFLETKSPSIEFQQFAQVMIAVALKALDIPYSFYAENFTNYSGARQALLQYQLAADNKRADVLAMLNWLTTWRIRLWLLDGALPGVDPMQLRYEWIPKGVPWIDPAKEIAANVTAVHEGLASRTRLLREQGIDFYDLIDELAAEKTALESRGLYQAPITAAATPQAPEPDDAPPKS